MFRQGAIGEAKSLHGVFFIEGVDDATGIQRIEPEVMYRNRNVASDQYRGARPMEPHPRQAEHLPCANRFRCPLPRNFASAKLDATVIYVVRRWHSRGRRSYLRVREA